jgi:large subunit ribosomal protein L23
MINAYDCIIRPIVTEKSTYASKQDSKSHGGAYAFQVHPRASKAQIKDAVEKIYNVKVDSVRTMVCMGKTRRYRFFFAPARPWKKAIVVVEKGQAIDLF